MQHNAYFFKNLVLAKRIQQMTVTCQKQRIQQELNSLATLSKRTPSYLNDYDQLFRYISLWLLQHGYDLTEFQPHQTLKAVCQFNCPDWQIELVIEHRHMLKKGMTQHVDPVLYQELQHCLKYFQNILQAYENTAFSQ